MLNGFEISALVLLGSIVAGFFGAASGLGGAVLVIPALTIGLGVDLHYAIGAGIVAALTTSSVSLLTQLRFGSDKFRSDVSLEVAAAAGALTGAFLSPQIPIPVLSALLGIVLLQAAVHLGYRRRLPESQPRSLGSAPSLWLRAGMPIALFGTGVLSGLLGVGGGSLHSSVLGKASGTRRISYAFTTNALIAVTAALSASIYLSRGYLQPVLAAPVLLGALVGSLLGLRDSAARVFPSTQPLCAICLAALGVQLLLNAWEAYL